MISFRKIHANRSEAFDTETGEILCCYAPGDGKLRFVWCNSDRNDTGRPVIMDEAALMTRPGWKLKSDGRPYLRPFDALQEHRAILD
jgi:hypothetical protein